jgi:hypothetical protein
MPAADGNDSVLCHLAILPSLEEYLSFDSGVCPNDVLYYGVDSRIFDSGNHEK